MAKVINDKKCFMGLINIYIYTSKGFVSKYVGINRTPTNVAQKLIYYDKSSKYVFLKIYYIENLHRKS